MTEITALHLCCGAGGITLGFEQAGIRTAYAFDNNPICIETHRANFPGLLCGVMDIHNVHSSDLPAANVLTCGIPCEPYSIAGYRRQEADEREISAEVARLLGEIIDARARWPLYVFLENVPPYRSSVGAEMIRQALRNRGFDLFEAIFAHADYGVPQKRRRWHLLGVQVPPLSAPTPEPTHSEGGLLWPRWLTFGSIREHDIVEPHYLSARAWRGILRRQTRAEQRVIAGDFDSCYAKCYIVDDEDLLPTVLSSWYKGAQRNQATVIYDDGRFRAPTEREICRGQGFPDTYRFWGNQRDRYEMIGRAVPPPFAAAVARAIIAHAVRAVQI